MNIYISQPQGSMSCGAHAIAYYLWETHKDNHVNNRSFVESIYKNIKFGANDIGINEEYSNPYKMMKELNDNWNCKSYLCMLNNSPLMSLSNGLNISASNTDILNNLMCTQSRYSIIICSLEKSPNALHYILIKFEDNTFKMLNSSAYYGNGTDNVTWENFSVNSNGKINTENDSPYIYTNAGILIK